MREKNKFRCLPIMPWFSYDHGDREGAVRLDKILAFDSDSEWIESAGKGSWVIALRIIFENRSEPEVIKLKEKEYERFLSSAKTQGEADMMARIKRPMKDEC